jgi:hypothetical protein
MRGRVRLTNSDRWFLVQLYRLFPSILQVLTIIRPETMVRWIRHTQVHSPVGSRRHRRRPQSVWRPLFTQIAASCHLQGRDRSLDYLRPVLVAWRAVVACELQQRFCCANITLEALRNERCYECLHPTHCA